VDVLTGTQMLYAMPWLAMLVAVPFLLARRVRITSYPAPASDDAPMVSVIIPARNESLNISVCVASLLNTLYPHFEIVVVDDGSEDGTGDIVRILEGHSEGRLRLIEGQPLPPGWLGKPWACWQGYQAARGDVLLFTDADTRHDDTLLGHAVGALLQRRVDLVSVMPRQLMQSFWERLILPQIFTVLSMRYHDLERVSRTKRARDVIANGQFLLIRRDAYEAVGGHEALRDEVVEDQRLAQRLVESGRSMFIAHAHTVMETRMYRTFGGIVEGWSKNLALGSRRAAPGWIAPAVPWLIILFLLTAWVIPPTLLATGVLTGYGAGVRGWALASSVYGLLFWLVIHMWMRVPVQYALGFPVGALATAVLFARSAIRGGRVRWKGRDYAGPAAGADGARRRP
jgi:chlorobactene glucosyltransferase